MACLSTTITAEIDRLLAEVDMVREYRAYRWKADSWMNGFPEICNLEGSLSSAARENRLGYFHARNLAIWGGLPNPLGIRCQEPLNLALYTGGKPSPWLRDNADNVMRMLESQIRGFGPTYCSKMLRFSVPSVFGAIDTRLVRVFGSGDPGAQEYQLLDLQVTRSDPRWAIPSHQESWPMEYGTWTAIPHRMAGTLNEGSIACPHPMTLSAANLREQEYGCRPTWKWRCLLMPRQESEKGNRV